MLTTTDEEYHRAVRKGLAPAFSSAQLRHGNLYRALL